DTRDGLLLRDADAKERAAARHDYALLADRVLIPVERHHVDLEPLEDLAAQHALHGWGFEDVKFVVDAMAESGAEPVYSMGDDIPIAALGRTPRRVYGYLRQRFAQVTNPAIALSDRGWAQHRLPVPMALAVGAVHSHLLETGRRMATDIVAIAGDAVDVHDVACLITIGATAVHPYLAFATVAQPHPPASPGNSPQSGEDSIAKYRKALEAGLLKVMAKMGISCVTSYRGAEVIEALGLGAEVMELCFPAVPS